MFAGEQKMVIRRKKAIPVGRPVGCFVCLLQKWYFTILDVHNRCNISMMEKSTMTKNIEKLGIDINKHRSSVVFLSFHQNVPTLSINRKLRNLVSNLFTPLNQQMHTICILHICYLKAFRFIMKKVAKKLVICKNSQCYPRKAEVEIQRTAASDWMANKFKRVDLVEKKSKKILIRKFGIEL